jgi:hypothetical protein
MGSRSLALALSIFLLAPSAFAAPTAAERESARRLMDDGKHRTKAGDLAGALEAYQKAHDLMHVPSTGIALARTQVDLGHLVEARDVALEVTRMAKEPGEPPVFEHARKAARELEASLKPRIPLLTINVKGGPVTAVTVDGAEVSPSLVGSPIAVNPGKRSVTVKNADGVEARGEVTLAEKETKELSLVLAAPKGDEPTKVVTGPVAPPPRPVEDEGGHRTPLANALVYGGFGVAVLGLGVGGATGFLASSKASDVKAQCENNICDPAAKSDLDSAKSMATISTIGFAVGGAGLVAGAIGLFLPKDHTTTTAVWVGPGSVGLAGAF